ncbi:sunset domain-containing protein [Rhodobacter capsulatus]|uniref:sunset domain-containing protein n=1 Tax=Rhodobacter capsulatus TaxID=1061 RepID=UPI00402A4A85
MQTPPGACRIKGNISKKGQIFHLPGSRDYDRTRIDETRGERWFCTEAEARAAGWRPMGS